MLGFLRQQTNAYCSKKSFVSKTGKMKKFASAILILKMHHFFEALIDATTRGIAERLTLSNSTIYDNLRHLGLTSKLNT